MYEMLRHSALTEKSKLKSNTLNQHAGWSMNSNMAQKYIHYFGNESSESLLEAYGIVTKNNVPIDTLNPKICPNCNEGNTADSKFCSKCKMTASFKSAINGQAGSTADVVGNTKMLVTYQPVKAFHNTWGSYGLEDPIDHFHTLNTIHGIQSLAITLKLSQKLTTTCLP
jgi:hypothetical protein